MPVRAECELFDTWTKDKKPFTIQPSQEERVKRLAPANISIYCGQDGKAVFINVSNGLEYTQVFKSAGPGKKPKQIDDIEPAVIRGKEVLTVKSTLHNEILTVRLVNGSGSSNPNQPLGQSRLAI